MLYSRNSCRKRHKGYYGTILAMFLSLFLYFKHFISLAIYLFSINDFHFFAGFKEISSVLLLNVLLLFSGKITGNSSHIFCPTSIQRIYFYVSQTAPIAIFLVYMTTIFGHYFGTLFQSYMSHFSQASLLLISLLPQH